MAQSGTRNGVPWEFTLPREVGIERLDCGLQTEFRRFESTQDILVMSTYVTFQLLRMNLLDMTTYSVFAFIQILYIWRPAQATGHVGYGIFKKVHAYGFLWAIRVQFRL